MDPGTNIFNPWITTGYNWYVYNLQQGVTHKFSFSQCNNKTNWGICSSNIPHIQFPCRRNKGSVFALTHLSLISSSCQKHFPSNCFFSNPKKKWKLLSVMSQLSGGQIRYSQQSMCKLLYKTFWDNTDTESLWQDNKVKEEWVQTLGLSSLMDSNMCVLLGQMSPLF